MPKRLSCFPCLSVALLTTVFTLSSAPAFAGFQWVAPTQVISAPTQAQSWPEPVIIAPAKPAVTSDIISPVIIGGSAPAPVAAPAPVVTSTSSVVAVAPAASSVPAGDMRSNVSRAAPTAPVVGGEPVATSVLVAPSSAPVSVLPPPSPAVPVALSSGSEIVRGFAKKVPLAVALRQILPSGYGFSIDPDVDLGTLISFQGGKGWRETLQDALTPSGLAMREQGQMVMIGHASVPMSAPVATVIAPSPTPVAVAAPMPLPQPISVMPAASVASSVSATPAAMSPVVEEWRADRGDTLHKVMQNWASRSRVELNWIAEYDYPLQASYVYTGTFEDAVRNLLTGFQEAHPQPVAELHDNPALGQRVLVVQTRGNTNTD